MRRALPAILVLAVAAIAASTEEVVYQGDLHPLNILPTFDHGYLAVYEDGEIAVYGRDGVQTFKITIPDQLINNADIDTDGSAAVAMGRPGDVSGHISFYNPDGSPAGQIATGAVIPSQVCFAPDHSIWVLDTVMPKSWDDQPDYALLRHYSRRGELLGEYLPRSSFHESINPDQRNLGGWGIRAANGRIGVAVRSNGGAYTWVEVGFDGNEIGRWALPDGSLPGAFTDRGDVYARGNGLKVLDHTSGFWKVVPEGSRDSLLGAEGDSLVFEERGTSVIRRSPRP